MSVYTGASHQPKPPTTNVYKGKFKDRFPGETTAGLLTFTGSDTAKQCLNIPDRPIESADVRRFRNYTSTGVDNRRIHYGIARDPQLEKAINMVHGRNLDLSNATAAEVLNPMPKTLYQQRFIDRLESVYKKPKMAPLGRVPSTVGKLPSKIDLKTHTFGQISEKYDSAAELINPPLSFYEVYAQDQKDHDTYLKPYTRLYPGEQAFRKYENFDPLKVYGERTTADREGRATKQCLTWATQLQNQKVTPLVEKKLDEFRERTQHQLGKTLDPIKDTLNVPDDHVFGLISQKDPYNVGQILRGEVPKHFINGPERQKGIVGACRYHLKQESFQHLPDLAEAFAQVDKECRGVLPSSVIRDVLSQVSVPLTEELTEQLLDYCDPDSKQEIDWRELVECLNWKNRLCFNSVRPDSKMQSAPAGGSSLNRRMNHNVRRALLNWTTTNGQYNGGGPLNANDMVRYGAPSMRVTEYIPKYRRVSDTQTNYGDEPSAYSIIHPSIYQAYGVQEIDLRIPRTKEDIKSLFNRIGTNMSDDVFEEAWRMAEGQDPNGQVNIDAFKKVVDGLEAHRIKVQVARENTFF